MNVKEFERGDLKVRTTVLGESPYGNFQTVKVQLLKKKTIVTINDLLPPDIIIDQPLPGEECGNAADHHHVIWSATNDMPVELEPGSLLALLHEIGHALSIPKFPDNDWYRRYFQRKHFAEIRQGSDPVTVKDYVGVVIAEERDAWAYALWQRLLLQKRGLDCEPRMDHAEAKKYAHDNLRTYLSHQGKQVLDPHGRWLQNTSIITGRNSPQQ